MALETSVGSVGGGREKAERGNRTVIWQGPYISLPQPLWSVCDYSLCPVRNVCTDISEMFGPQENTCQLDTSVV